MKVTAKATATSAFLLTTILLPVPKPAQAQFQESFSQCVQITYENTDEDFSATDAAEDCLEAYRGKPMGESVSECISSLHARFSRIEPVTQYCGRVSRQSQPSIPVPNPRPHEGQRVPAPINQGYNQVGGVWFGPDGQIVPAERRPGEDQATCISRLRFMTLNATSQSETHGDYRYDYIPAGVTVQQMAAAGLEDHGGFFSFKWRGSRPQVTLTLMGSQAATIRCR